MDTFLHPEKVKTAEEFRSGNASNQKYWEAQGHNGCNPYKNVSCKKTIGYFTIEAQTVKKSLELKKTLIKRSNINL